MAQPTLDLRLHAWLQLHLTPGVGPVSALRLLQALGSPEAIFQACAAQLHGLVSPTQAQALARPPATLADQWARTQAWWAAEPTQRHLLCLHDAAYPAGLRALPDPPPLLYVHGQLQRLAGPAVAVIGSRQCSALGRHNARHFAAGLSAAGRVVVSGLAIGIDGEAHEGALGGAGGTVAVLGSGLDTVYPLRHQPLAQRIIAEGALVSEFPLGTPPRPTHFPRRNRLIAGLCQGVLVVEAGLPSGSLITAQFAADQGREVFAIPGDIHAPSVHGCHHLIQQGAMLVQSVQDILDALPAHPTLPPPEPPSSALPSAAAPASAAVPTHGPGVGTPPPSARRSAKPSPPPPVARLMPPGAHQVLAVLEAAPASVEQLSQHIGWPPATLHELLQELALWGLVQRQPNGQFQRIAHA